MRRLYSKGLVASMEADLTLDNGETGGNIPAADVVGIDNSIQMEEVNQQSEVITSLEEEMVTADEASAEIEERVIPLAEAAAEDGGLDRAGAEAVAIAAESLFAFAGVAASRINMPAAESFGGRSTRVHQTKLAIEGIKESLQTIWENIIAGLKKAWSWIKDQYAKFFGAAEGLKKRAENIEKKAASTNGTAENKSFDDGSLFKKLYISDKVEAATSVTVVETQAKNALEALGKIISDNEANIAKFEDPVSKINEFTASSTPPSGLTAITTDKDGYEANGAGVGMQWVKSEELPGGKALVSKVPTADKTGKEALEDLGKMKLSIGAFNLKRSEPSKETLTTLSPNDAETVAKTVKKMAENLMLFRKKKEDAEKALDKLIKAGTKVADRAIKEEPSGTEAEKTTANTNKDIYKAARSYLAGASGVLVAGPASVFQYCLATGKAYLDYCDKSLSQYKAK